MKLSQYKLIFTAVGLIGILLIASPVLAEILEFPTGEQFSELYLLGADQMAQDIPFNIKLDQNYTVYLGVGNHLGTATYYIFEVKLRNQTEPSPNSDIHTESSLPTIYEYRAIVQNGENYTAPLTFFVPSVSVSNDQTKLQSVAINGVEFTVNKVAQYDQENNGYYYQLFVELWAYNPSDISTSYQNRWVYFWFNITSPK